jgi:hypothetical protein
MYHKIQRWAEEDTAVATETEEVAEPEDREVDLDELNWDKRRDREDDDA